MKVIYYLVNTASQTSDSPNEEHNFYMPDEGVTLVERFGDFMDYGVIESHPSQEIRDALMKGKLPKDPYVKPGDGMFKYIKIHTFECDGDKIKELIAQIREKQNLDIKVEEGFDALQKQRNST